MARFANAQEALRALKMKQIATRVKKVAPRRSLVKPGMTRPVAPRTPEGKRPLVQGISNALSRVTAPKAVERLTEISQRVKPEASPSVPPVGKRPAERAMGRFGNAMKKPKI